MADALQAADADDLPAAWLSQMQIVYRSALRRSEPAKAPAFLSHLTDDSLVAFYARAEVAKAEAVAPLEWAAKTIAVEIERRLHERRRERGNDEAKIEIPHPLVEVVLEAQFGSYQFDTDQAIEAVRGLPDDERAKLVIVTPAHTRPAYTVPAEDVPESVRMGSVASWKSAASRFAGTAIGKMIDASFKRDRLGDRVTIKPRKIGGKR
ncbi:MAG: hypothetical protein IAI49_06220 [Candidatus Eremiobacteraeota bacterium]|nr:hypothetical protein [Candidatus Eremiobacteraeota bacterium]